MKGSMHIITKKYAQAYINVFGIHKNQLISSEKILFLFIKHKKSIFFLSFLSKSTTHHNDTLIQICKHAGLPEQPIKKLIFLLLKNKAIELLPAIIEHILELYRKQFKICMVNVITSHPIDNNCLEVINTFLVHYMKCTVICLHKTDPSLIAGIRLQSVTHMWEYSISRQLNRMHAKLIS